MEWRLISELPKNQYYISENGDFKRVGRGKDKIYKQKLTNAGYRYVHVWKDGKTVPVRIARMVGKYFIPNPENKPQINHIDGNKLNNHYINLEWVTRRENLDHAMKSGFIGALNPNRSTFKKSVGQYDISGNLLKKYKSMSDAARINGFDRASISRTCAGTLKTYKGFVWKTITSD